MEEVFGTEENHEKVCRISQ